MSKHTLIIIALAIFALAKIAKGLEYFFLKNEVEQLPVTFRCQSGDEDMGTQEVAFGATFEHKFKGMWPTTLYFCHFYLGNKDKVFDVWVYKRDKEGCTVWKKNPWYMPDKRVHGGQVEWVIKADGFHKHCVYEKREVDDYGRMKKAPPETMLEKKHDWW